ncbi:BACK domain-containing protein [Aphelenchoides besseyi]|nr:BACK domain-containing protein [Aphelenchoides besseyi]
METVNSNPTSDLNEPVEFSRENIVSEFAHHLNDSTVLTIGGTNAQAQVSPLTYFNRQTCEWTSIDQWKYKPNSLKYFAVTHFPHKRKLFVISGTEELDTKIRRASQKVTLVYTNTLSQASYTRIPKNVIGRIGCDLSSDHMIACGGILRISKPTRNIMSQRKRILALSYICNVEKGDWTEIKRMINRRANGVAVNMDGSVYVVAGSEGTFAMNQVEYFEASQNRWISAPPLLSRRMHHSALWTNRVLFVCGGIDRNYMNDDPIHLSTADLWMPVKTVGTQDSAFGLTEIDGYPFVIGGFNGVESIADCELFDWRANTWIEMPSLPVAASGLRAVRVN